MPSTDNSKNGDFHIGSYSLGELVQEYGLPLYVYDSQAIRERVNLLKTHLPFFELLYSVKANPNYYIASLLSSLGCGMEVASLGELHLVSELLKHSSESIVFAGPGKTDREILKAVTHGIYAINVESYNELHRVDRIAGEQGITAKVQLRVHTIEGSAHAVEQMVGVPSQFGIHETELHVVKQLNLKHVDIIGIHVYTGSQILDESAIRNNFSRTVRVSQSVEDLLGRKLESINFGGGLGVPYSEHERSLNLRLLGNILTEVVEKYRLYDKRILIELGRFLVAEAGVYLTRVIDVKNIDNNIFVVVEGGMNHQIRPAFMKLNHPTVLANKLNEKPIVKASVVGQLCTPLDILAKDIDIPFPEIDDVVAIYNSGAYGYTMSMLNFLSHPSPSEVLIDGNMARIIRPKGDIATMFNYVKLLEETAGTIP